MCNHHNHAAACSAEQTQDYRLPTEVVPSRYKLRLTPGLKVTDDDSEEIYKFTGHQKVNVDILESTDRIVVNAKNLDIHEAYVLSKGSKRRFNGTVVLDDKNELAIVTFDRKLAAGKWTFCCRFTGTHNTKLKGFYLSVWEDNLGGKHQIFTTQFESTDARQAFPCWDEPAFKAEFDVQLVVPQKLVALSNGRDVKTESLGNGWKIVTYQRTPKMSTYLVAFCVGEFESSEPVFTNGKELRIWSIPGKNHLKSFAIKCAKFGVEFYEDFFGRPYFGGDKIDMIAIPDFASGAMENTGLITYRDTALLVDEDKASYGEKARVAEVVLHELDHQWNGNEVTMDWWDGLGLNESFATIMAYVAMNSMFPEWHIYNEFGLDRAQAFALDSLKTTHPVFAPINHPSEIAQRFDAITYEKGGSLLFQCIQFIGYETFRHGLRIYMNRHALANTRVTDLWDALEEACKLEGKNIPVRSFMDAWMNTAGHPIVSVEEISGKPGAIRLSQSQFLFLGDDAATAPLWPVPVHIRYKSANGTIKEDKFLFCDLEHEVDLGENFDWLVVNASGPGFYRVAYGASLLSKLTGNISETLEVIERFNLVNDSWAAVRARLMSATDYLDLVKTFSNENDPNVWAIIGSSLRALYGLTEGAARKVFKEAIIRQLVGPVFNQLGWQPQPGESVHTLQLRGQLANLLGTIGSDEAVREKARDLFEQWKADRASVDPNVVPALIAILAHTGNRTRFDEFQQLSDVAPTTQEKLRFLAALGGFRDSQLYSSAIALMLSDKVRSQDAPFLLAGIIGTEHAGKAAWDTMRTEVTWKQIVETFPDNAVPRMIGSLSALDTPECEAQIIAFFDTHTVKEGDMAVAQMKERLRVNVLLREQETAKLADYLSPVALASCSN